MKFWAWAIFFFAWACGGDPLDPPDASAPQDAGHADVFSPDVTVGVDAAPVDSGAPDASAPDAQNPDANTPDAQNPDASAPDAAPSDASAPDAETADAGDPCAAQPCFPGVLCTPDGAGFICGPCPAGYVGDGITCTDEDGCVGAPCLLGCTDVPAPNLGYTCDPCPPGYVGDGVTCTDEDACAQMPCLPTTTCTDLPAPSTGFTCSPCVGPACPVLRALAGPDQQIVAGTTVTLMGDAVGYNGAFNCVWANNQDATVVTTCTTTVSPSLTTVYTLTVTDFSGASASDTVRISLAELTADAGSAHNIVTGGTATLVASWAGASCADGSCISCSWALSTGAVAGTTCILPVSPAVTTQYFLTVTDGGNGRTATDSTAVFVTDVPANLCGWNVVVMTSNEYPSTPNPNYTCDGNGTARRQTVNGKPAIVLSDLAVQNTKIVGHISVETTADDDLIGFLWGWQNPAHAYLLTWKQLNQNWTANCGNALAGIAVKKIDGPLSAPTTISFNPSFGFMATDYVYRCAVGWSTDRNNANLLGTEAQFLVSPRDVGAYTGGWRDAITYRFEFYYTPTRTKIFVYEDDLMNGSTTTLVTTLDLIDSSYPEGQFAFFSNSQEQVGFGDFVLASLDGYLANAGPDATATLGQQVLLSGSATLAVPPYACQWSLAGAALGATCDLTVTSSATATYELLVTDAFGRVATDDVTITVAP